MCHVGHATAVVRRRVIGAQFYRSRVISDRACRVPLQIIGKAPVVVGLGVVWLQLDGGGVVGDGSVVLMDAGQVLTAFQVELRVSCRTWRVDRLRGWGNRLRLNREHSSCDTAGERSGGDSRAQPTT